MIFPSVYISISTAVICFRLTLFNGEAFPFHRGHMWWRDVEEGFGGRALVVGKESSTKGMVEKLSRVLSHSIMQQGQGWGVIFLRICWTLVACTPECSSLIIYKNCLACPSACKHHRLNSSRTWVHNKVLSKALGSTGEGGKKCSKPSGDSDKGATCHERLKDLT